MNEERILDIAHVSFYEMIRVMIALSGPASSKGLLIRNAMRAAEQLPITNYATFEEYVAAIERGTNPVAMMEGKAAHLGSFIFGLKTCPFEPSIRNYTRVFQGLPEGYEAFTEEFNKPSQITEQLRVGDGSGVSPFCSVHQPMRAAFAQKIRIGGKPVTISQLGCKSSSGKKGFAKRCVAESGVPQAVLDKVLDQHVCCYSLKVG